MAAVSGVRPLDELTVGVAVSVTSAVPMPLPEMANTCEPSTVLELFRADTERFAVRGPG